MKQTLKICRMLLTICFFLAIENAFAGDAQTQIDLPPRSAENRAESGYLDLVEQEEKTLKEKIDKNEEGTGDRQDETRSNLRIELDEHASRAKIGQTGNKQK